MGNKRIVHLARYSFIMLWLIAAYVCSAETPSAVKQWRQMRDNLKRDPSVIRYYTFENVADSSTVIPNLAGDSGHLSFIPLRTPEGVIDDLEVIEGRIPGKKAVRLDRGWYQGNITDIKDNTFTAECWFRIHGPATEYEGVTGRLGTLLWCGAETGWMLFPGEDSLVSRISFEGDRNRKAVAYGLSMPEHRWHHAAVTWDGSEILLYFNGSQVGRGEHAGQYVPTNIPLMVGRNTAKILDIDEVVIYSRTLSAAEIRDRATSVEGETLLEVRAVLELGRQLLSEGLWADARTEYANLTAMDSPEIRVPGLTNTALSYRKEGNYGMAKQTYGHILALDGLSDDYRIYTLFNIADMHTETGNHAAARGQYADMLEMETLPPHHRMRALFGTGDSYRGERNYTGARKVYAGIQSESEAPPFPNEHYRTKAIDRLKVIEGLDDGMEFTCPRDRRTAWTERPATALYVCTTGDDGNPGTKDRPLATPERARNAIREIKSTTGLPGGGITVYLRQGLYFRDGTFVLESQDSGTEDSPVVYRAYPGETVRFIGGKQVQGFMPVTDEAILARLPEQSRGRVMQADLKAQGITDYGELLHRGFVTPQPAAMELSYNGKIMDLARWPNEGWARVAALVDPQGDGSHRGARYQKGKFIYSGDRPERWKEEDEIWIKGYLGVNQPYVLRHAKVERIDTENRLMYLQRGINVAADHAYFAYNLLSELSAPGEWYVDRTSGVLYVYPPGPPGAEDEVLVSTLDSSIVSINGASHVVLRDITFELTRRSGIVMMNGSGNLIAGCTVRNTGQNGIIVGNRYAAGSGGRNNVIAGCDIHDTGESGIFLLGGELETLTPSEHIIDNCRIYRFNRFCGGYRPAVDLRGAGSRVSHNLIYDAPHFGIHISGNDHIIEYNEFFDVLHEASENGVIYIYQWGRPMMARGHVIRHNFFHHIVPHSSPAQTHGINAIHLDAVNAGLTIYGNIFYRCARGISTGGGREFRIENNIFAECWPGISAGNRMYLFETEEGQKRLQNGVEAVSYQDSPWLRRYPQIEGILTEQPRGVPKNSIVERNISIHPQFLRAAPGWIGTNHVRDNFIDRDPLVRGMDNLDFRLWDGSPAYGAIGFEPLPFDEIGLYEDTLRASWPVDREYGKYYKAEKTVTLSPREHTVRRRTQPVRIDGILRPEEWGGLDRSRAMTVEEHFKGDGKTTGSKTYAWAFYDDDYLYIGLLDEQDRKIREGEIASNLFVEISIEGQHGPEQTWWMEDMPTGPIYVLWGYPDGRLDVRNPYGAPSHVTDNLQGNTAYAAAILDEELMEWTAEWKIPFEHLGVNPHEVETFQFNIGVVKRDGWLAWSPTGGTIHLLEYGGTLRLQK